MLIPTTWNGNCSWRIPPPRLFCVPVTGVLSYAGIPGKGIYRIVGEEQVYPTNWISILLEQHPALRIWSDTADHLASKLSLLFPLLPIVWLVFSSFIWSFLLGASTEWCVERDRDGTWPQRRFPQSLEDFCWQRNLYLCSLFCPGCVERLGQGGWAGDESSLCAFENEHALCSFSTNVHVENENIDALGNSVDHIVICWLSITEIGLKPTHPVGVDCRNVM